MKLRRCVCLVLTAGGSRQRVNDCVIGRWTADSTLDTGANPANNCYLCIPKSNSLCLFRLKQALSGRLDAVLSAQLKLKSGQVRNFPKQSKMRKCTWAKRKTKDWNVSLKNREALRHFVCNVPRTVDCVWSGAKNGALSHQSLILGDLQFLAKFAPNHREQVATKVRRRRLGKGRKRKTDRQKHYRCLPLRAIQPLDRNLKDGQESAFLKKKDCSLSFDAIKLICITLCLLLV